MKQVSTSFFEKKEAKKLLLVWGGAAKTGAAIKRVKFFAELFFKKATASFPYFLTQSRPSIGPQKAVPSRGVRAILASRPTQRISTYVYLCHTKASLA